MNNNQQLLGEWVKEALKPSWGNQVSIVDLNESVSMPQNESAVIGVGNNLTPEAVISSAADHALSQIVQETSLDAKRAIMTSGQMLFSANEFLRYPISAILSPQTCGPATEADMRKIDFDFNSSEQKSQLLQMLEDYLGAFIKRSSTIGELISVADEVYSNAIFNAPFVDDDNRKGTARGEGYVVSDRNAKFLAGHDENSVAIVVVDQYGSLKMDVVLKKILKTYQEGADNTIQLEGTGGAGLGTFMVFERSCSMYLAVKPGELTIVGAVMPINMSRKKKMQLSKNLHLLEVPTTI